MLQQMQGIRDTSGIDMGLEGILRVCSEDDILAKGL
jgi:hypothetical protein